MFNVTLQYGFLDSNTSFCNIRVAEKRTTNCIGLRIIPLGHVTRSTDGFLLFGNMAEISRDFRNIK